MKKTISLGIVFLFCVSMVFAGSVDNLDYKDKPDLWLPDNNRVINDNNVNIDSDTLNGKTSGQIIGDARDYSDAGDLTEANIRAGEDTAINGRIDTEIIDRQNGDNILDNKINQEISDRTTADNNLQNDIDNEISDRINADIIEKNARKSADNAEKNARQNADNQEKIQRQLADIGLGVAIGVVDTTSKLRDAQERNARENADDVLQSNIDIEEADRILGDDSIKTTIADNNERWTRDNAGMDDYKLSYFLVGYTTIFDQYDTFIDYLYSIFATKKQVEQLEKRVTYLETEIGVLKEALNIKINPDVVDTRIGLIQSQNTAEPITTESGKICDAKLGNCIKFINMPEEQTPKEIIELPSDKQTDYEYHIKILKQWQKLCDDGLKQYCNSVEQGKAKWGITYLEVYEDTINDIKNT